MYSQIDLNFINALLGDTKFQIILLLLIIWNLIWKGVALWKSARHNQRYWFIAILLINTFGILEIIYTFYFSSLNRNAGKTNGPQ